MTTVSAYKSQLAWLREEYQNEKNPNRKEALKEDAKKLKDRYGCYECGEEEKQADDMPFCSDTCHEAWAAKHIKTVRDEKVIPSIQEMQERLKQMGKEVAEHGKKAV